MADCAVNMMSMSSSSSRRVGNKAYINATNMNMNMNPSSSHHSNDKDNDDDDERTIVLRTMKALEKSVYKRPRAECLPDMFRGLWRKQIVEWMYVLVKFCKLRHEATAAAVHYLDVAVWASASSSSSPISISLVQTPWDYQLCAMASLHLALKVYDSPTVRVIKLSDLVKLGGGQFTEDDIIQKEHDLLRVLRWRINPPTANCFLQRYLELVPLFELDEEEDSDDDDNDHYECGGYIDSDEVNNYEDQLRPIERRRRERVRKIEEIAIEFIEVATRHDRFLSVPSSVIAYAALLSAIELSMKRQEQNEQQHQHQQNFCLDYDLVTFLQNMKTIAEMGDLTVTVTNDEDCNGDGICLSRMVLRTKMLLERIVQGVPVPPEEDDGYFFNSVFATKTKMYCDENSNRDHNNNWDGNNNNEGKYCDKKSSSGEFRKLSTNSSSSSLSPTSTI